jgi:CO/xanthine dehydrogenase FAD-binding subunit
VLLDLGAGTGDAADGAADGGALIARAPLRVGCVGPTAIALPSVEARLRGLALSEVEEEVALARDAGDDIDAVSDLHRSAEYTRHLVGVFVARALAQAVGRAGARTA